MCCEPKSRLWLLFDVFVVIISLVIKMQVQCLAPKTSKAQDFDAKLQAIDAKTSGNNLTTLSFVLFFQKHKIHNMLSMMLDPCFKGLRLVI
jgi:hypothetical protein